MTLKTIRTYLPPTYLADERRPARRPHSNHHAYHRHHYNQNHQPDHELNHLPLLQIPDRHITQTHCRELSSRGSPARGYHRLSSTDFAPLRASVWFRLFKYSSVTLT